MIQVQVTRSADPEERNLVLSTDVAVMRALADPFSRAIIISTGETAKSVEELSAENGIPVSTCYRRVKELLEEKILVVERIIINGEGKKRTTYRAAIRGINVDFGPEGLKVSALPNEDVADKLHSKWMTMTFGSSGMD